MQRFRPSRAAVVVAVVFVAFAGAVTPALAQPADGTYVALGDSYTAGPLVPVQSGVPAGCLRSTGNYPSLVGHDLGVASVRDVSCSGATTANLTGPQEVPLGVNQPQLVALDDDVSLVTVGIGGNDIGFASIVADCAARSPLHPFGAACRDFYTAGGADQLAARVDETGPKVAAVLDEIATRAPQARVLVVGYPAILPDSGPGCFPVVPFTPGDVAYLRSVEQELNTMLATQAAAAGVDYVDVYTPSIGHDVCTDIGTRWVEGLVPTSPAAPMHPNARGMRGAADAVLGALGAVSPSA